MALNIAKPFVNVTDANGLPIVGSKLYVYQPGTTTLASIFSDEALTVPMSNPLEGVNASDAAGNFPRAYIAAGTYKLRAVTSADVLIWQHDNIDTGLPAGTGALPISRGGTGATTAAAARANLDVPSNSELTAISEQIATFTAALQTLASNPQGRLTLTTLTPVLTTGVTAGTAVYYTPYNGNLCPIWDGVQFNLETFAELTLTLNSNHVLNSIYDVYVINDGSAGITLATGPAWNTITAGAGARGSGAGTAEITRLRGLWVNANAMTVRNGATTYSVGANLGTMVGSIYIDGTAGQVSCLTAYGQSRKFGVWNAYNRVTQFMKCGDDTSSWATVGTTTRPQNNNTANKLTIFCGLPEEYFHLTYKQNATNNIANALCGIGYNSTTAFSGPIAYANNGYAEFLPAPFIGINDVTALESQIASGAVTFGGSQSNMCLSAWWRG